MIKDGNRGAWVWGCDVMREVWDAFVVQM